MAVGPVTPQANSRGLAGPVSATRPANAGQKLHKELESNIKEGLVWHPQRMHVCEHLRGREATAGEAS